MQNSYWNGLDLVQSSTRDRLLRQLEEDRPSAIWFSMPEGPGPRPPRCFTTTDHRRREQRRRHLLIQANTVAVIQRALTTNWTCQVYTESLGHVVGEVLFPVLSQPHRVRKHGNMWHRQCSKSWTVWSSNGRIKKLNRCVQQPVERTISDQSRNVEMPSTLIKTLTELIILHVTIDELEHMTRLGSGRLFVAVS